MDDTEEQAMQIVYRTGDVIDGEEFVLIHGCNTLGVMGAGFAKAVRERLTFAYTAYRQVYLERGLKLGEVIWAIDIGPGRRSKIVGNAITQGDVGFDGRQYVDYEAIRRAMREVDHFVSLSHKRDNDGRRLHIQEFDEITAVAMPAIGSGLGGGDWSTIAAIIEEESRHFTPVVYELPKKD